jgi:hypothetical protein
MDRRLLAHRGRAFVGLCGVCVAAALTICPQANAATIVKVQSGTLATGSATIAPSLSSPSTVGDLLVAVLQNTVNSAFTAPSGWVKAISTENLCCGRAEIWYYQSNPGGIAAATFSASSGTLGGQLSEWSGVATSGALDKTGSGTSGSSGSFTVSTSAATTVANELTVTDLNTNGSNITSISPGGGWANLFSNLVNGDASDYRIDLPAGTASETASVSPNESWVGTIAAFKPAGCVGGSLTLTAPSAATFPAVTLSGTDQTASAGVGLTVDDETASGSGWNVTGTSTTFTTGTQTLSTSATRDTAASRSTIAGNCSLPTNSITYPVTLPAGTSPPTAVKLYNAAVNTGAGPTKVTLTFQLAIPANTYHGTYTSTWTFAIVSGP